MSAPAATAAPFKGAIARFTRADDAWYVVAATVVNVANFAFFGLVGHLLRPSAYGAVATLLNVVSIAAIPLNALQAAVVQETVLQSRDGAAPTVRRAGIAFAVAGLLVMAVIAASAPAMVGFFGLASVVPVLLLAVWFAPSVSSSLYDGVLIGTLHWRPIAVSLIAGAVVRVGVALVVGLADPGVAGPVLATVLNAAVTLGVVVWALRRLGATEERTELRLPLRGVLPTVGALTGYSVLVAVDTLLARHTLTPGDSGAYAAAVTVGRIALFIPMTVTTIAFPRMVADGGRGPRARRLLTMSLGSVLALGLVAAGALAACGHVAVSILFGHRYEQAVALIATLSAEGAILGGIGLMTYFHLSRRSRLAALPAATVVLVTATVLVVTPGAQALARVMVLAALLCLAAMVAGAYAKLPFSTKSVGFR
jgi:O-antigen/teichoic acid export membrane protein